jgi:hypothetical protein
MTNHELSELQQQYRAFFLGRLNTYRVASPAQLSKAEKSEFFSGIRRDWARIKQKINNPSIVADRDTVLAGSVPKVIRSYSSSARPEEKAGFPQPELISGISTEVIESRPNPEQTDDLRILYVPNNFYKQEMLYQYPVVKMPALNSPLKLPRNGRSNQKGYKERDFFLQLKKSFPEFELSNDFHVVIPHFSRPYEPDIVLFDRSCNLYIDIEIDEPYDGYYRYPTHNRKAEEQDKEKQDDVRDRFFTESGWVVIRFSEKQVHCHTGRCIEHIRNVLNSILKKEQHIDNSALFREEQWDDNQSIQWQKIFYRENYLGISRFQKQRRLKEIIVGECAPEGIESIIKRTRRYIHPKDDTGNAEYISVTTLIERFFPFDLKRFIAKKAQEEGRPENDILLEHLMIRDEAAEKGTTLHKQIENFLKAAAFDADFPEFRQFTDFYNNEIKQRKLIFFEAEKVIYSDRFKVAGTIDCLFRKPGSDEFVMLDWKRSKKLVIDGQPRIFGYGYASSELSHLDNSSYYRYCLQQNIYKIIAETEFSLKISSMKLVVLHEHYPTYYVVNVHDMKKEAMIILNSINLKI